MIKGMDMPESCFGCAFCSPLVIPDEIYFCDCPVVPDGLDITEAVEEDYRHSDCPVVEIKTPHGRLIDADDVKSRMIPLSFSVQKWIGEVELSNCKTVIKEERE
jgi:hypothetical protein